MKNIIIIKKNKELTQTIFKITNADLGEDLVNLHLETPCWSRWRPSQSSPRSAGGFTLQSLSPCGS